jgi:hypothetical protein
MMRSAEGLIGTEIEMDFICPLALVNSVRTDLVCISWLETQISIIKLPIKISRVVNFSWLGDFCYNFERLIRPFI